MNEGVQHIHDRLSDAPSKTANRDRYILHLNAFSPNVQALFDAHHRKKSAKLAFHGHMLRNSVIDTFVAEALNDAKRRHLELYPWVRPEQVEFLLIVGLPTFGSTGRGERAVPTLWLAEHLARRWQALFVDEGFTTKTCPDCLQDTVAATMAPLHHPGLNKVVRRLNKTRRTLERRVRKRNRLHPVLSLHDHRRVAKLEDQMWEGGRRVDMLEAEKADKENMLVTQGIPTPRRACLASTRFCETCRLLGYTRPRKDRDVSAALNILAIGIALLAGLPRPAPFCDIREVRSAGQRMELVDRLLEPPDGIDRTRLRPRWRLNHPFARRARDLARDFLVNAVYIVHVKDGEVQDTVRYADRRALLRERREDAVPYAERANILLKWLLGEGLGDVDRRALWEMMRSNLPPRLDLESVIRNQPLPVARGVEAQGSDQGDVDVLNGEGSVVGPVRELEAQGSDQGDVDMLNGEGSVVGQGRELEAQGSDQGDVDMLTGEGSVVGQGREPPPPGDDRPHTAINETSILS